MKKSGGRARKAILQKMLDLLQSICYNTITSERFFFFCKGTGCNAMRPCACAFRARFQRVRVQRDGQNRGRRLLLRCRINRLELVKAKNISVKREVPL